MFLNNKYTKIYFKIISNAKQRAATEVYETHHILPKSLGGSNRKDNLVNLTLKEHYICHRLLIKMTTEAFKSKMIKAFYLMSCKHARKLSSSKVYEKLKQEFYQSCRGPKNWTTEGMKKLSEIGKLRTGDKNSFHGKKHTADTIEKIRVAHLGKTLTDQQRENISGENSSRFIGYYHTPWGVFPSSSLAAKSHEYLKSATIHRWCIRNDVKIVKIGRSRYLENIGSTCIGKTYKELGFYFIPKQPSSS